ncbi:GNAT family N-acetyltransferase [Streptomyces antimycoticus]|uniref:GNAT family N-acetyltransferase n=1 Tax=Streptomyces antimycoticus TaxID=68175 RepID=UPI00191BBEB6|nr:GNAT family protein [Streptomyces antimycoticus]WJD99645.1 GNAT family protein [Streptomyces antimycoticus]WTB07994.1 GNAT family N-acetyltransferase [Streptomyces antimycoticus]
MDPHYWPLYGLRLRTPRLELRLPDIPLLDELAAVAADGVHDPAEMPFSIPWTDAPPEERGRSSFQHLLGTIAEWRPEKWALSLAVLYEGAAIGRQDLFATEFAVTREAETGSWLGATHQGKGLGTEMRAAVAHLAFEGLGALSLTSGAMVENGRSLGVSRRLGYRPDGLSVVAVRGEARTIQRLRLDRAAWEEHRTTPVEMAGLEPCRPLFGAP